MKNYKRIKGLLEHILRESSMNAGRFEKEFKTLEQYSELSDVLPENIKEWRLFIDQIEFLLSFKKESRLEKRRLQTTVEDMANLNIGNFKSYVSTKWPYKHSLFELIDTHDNLWDTINFLQYQNSIDSEDYNTEESDLEFFKTLENAFRNSSGVNLSFISKLFSHIGKICEKGFTSYTHVKQTGKRPVDKDKEDIGDSLESYDYFLKKTVPDIKLFLNKYKTVTFDDVYNNAEFSGSEEQAREIVKEYNTYHEYLRKIVETDLFDQLVKRVKTELKRQPVQIGNLYLFDIVSRYNKVKTPTYYSGSFVSGIQFMNYPLLCELLYQSVSGLEAKAMIELN
jgi:hypothetical protein